MVNKILAVIVLSVFSYIVFMLCLGICISIMNHLILPFVFMHLRLAAILPLIVALVFWGVMSYISDFEVQV